MDVEYKGEHSILFLKDTGYGYVKRHSWTASGITGFFMIPVSRPYVSLGDANYSMIPIPGTNKRFDVTDYRPGGLTFGSRTGNWEFYIDHSKWQQVGHDWAVSYNTIQEYINGGRFLVNLTDDPYKLYQGVLTISGYVAGSEYSKITIQYDFADEVFILDEPIDYGDFGRLPEPQILDSDGDGVPDCLDLDGDDACDIPLAENDGYDTDCDGDPDILLPKGDRSKFQHLYDEDGYITALDIDGDGNGDYFVIDDQNGLHGFDYNCDDLVDTQTIPNPEDIDIPTDDDWLYFDLDCDGKYDETLDLKVLPGKVTKIWIYDSKNKVEGLDINGDGETDYYIITETINGVEWYGLDMNCDGHIDEGTEFTDPTDPPDPEDISDPPAMDIDWSYFDLDCDGEPDLKVPTSDVTKMWIYDSENKVEGLDINGDGEADYYIITETINGVELYGLDMNCDDHIDEGTEFDDPSDPPDPEDIPDPPAMDDENWVFITTCNVEKPIIKLPKDPAQRPKRKLIKNNKGELIGMDINNDDIIDYFIVKELKNGKFVYGFDLDCDGHIDVETPIEDPDPQDPDTGPDPTVVTGYDIDCDGKIDIMVDPDDYVNPTYIYDPVDGRLLGADCDRDGDVDIHAYPFDNDTKLGVDWNCDNVIDVWTPVPDTDPDADPEGGSEVIGAYYPLQFVTEEGLQDIKYGFASVNKSSGVLGVYDLYTIYQQDVVRPNKI